MTNEARNAIRAMVFFVVIGVIAYLLHTDAAHLMGIIAFVHMFMEDRP